jgi:transcription elongation factor GreB
MRFLGKRIEIAEIIEPGPQTDHSRVFFGATVTYAGEDDSERTVTIVGVDEADSMARRISLAAPLARALLGRRVGEEVTLQTPGGQVTVEVVAIRYGTV